MSLRGLCFSGSGADDDDAGAASTGDAPHGRQGLPRGLAGRAAIRPKDVGIFDSRAAGRDIGASLVALTLADAQAAGIDRNEMRFNRITRTANGAARFAVVTLPEIQLG